MQDRDNCCLDQTDMEFNGYFVEILIKKNDISVMDCKGNKLVQGMYIDGKKEGTWESWYNNGNLRWVHHYVNDQQIGNQASWYKTGQKETEAFFEKNNGHEVYWQQDVADNTSEYRRESNYYYEEEKK